MRLIRWPMVLVLGLLILFSAPVMAAESEEDHGKRYAMIWCSGCHQVGPEFPVRGHGPPFASIADDARYSAAYIRDWVTYPHTTMPHFRFSPRELDRLVSYIHSLRKPPATKCVTCAASPEGVKYSSGSGFYINGEGHVLTVDHVLRSCRRVTVEMPGQPSAPASVVARDASLDLALLATATRPAAFAGLGSEPETRVCDRVVSFSYPLSKTLSSSGVLSTGHIAALMGIGDDPDEFQISANLQAGASGGPVLDQWARLVGVAKSRLVATDPSELPPQGVSFAVSASAIRLFLAATGHFLVPSYPARALPLGDIGDVARSYTVRVICWR